MVAAIGYLVFAAWGGWHDVAAASTRVGWSGTALLLLLSLANYLLRFVRWQIYLRQLGHRVPWNPSLTIYLAGFALTTTPGKIGETLRSVFLKPWGVPNTASVAAFLSERLSDLFAIVILAAIGLGAHPQWRPLVLTAAAMCAVGVLLLGAGRVSLMARAGAASPRLSRVLHKLSVTATAARDCHRPAAVIPATALSLAAWSAEAFAFHLLLGWLGLQPDITFSFFIYAAGMLAGALSMLPGGLGGAEAAMMGLMLWAGYPQPTAVAAVLLIRLATLWFAVVLGMAALARLWFGQRQRAGGATGVGVKPESLP